jgi:hypothetical protein
MVHCLLLSINLRKALENNVLRNNKTHELHTDYIVNQMKQLYSPQSRPPSSELPLHRIREIMPTNTDLSSKTKVKKLPSIQK